MIFPQDEIASDDDDEIVITLNIQLEITQEDYYQEGCKNGGDKAASERVVAEKADVEKEAAEKAVAEKVAIEKAAKARAASEKVVAEKAAAKKAAYEKAAAEKAAKERAAAKKAAAEKAAAKRAAEEKAAAQREANLKSAYRIYPRDRPQFSMAVRDGKVVMAFSNPRDIYQKWNFFQIKGNYMLGPEGRPTFYIVNLGDGRALRNNVGYGGQVQLEKPNYDVSNVALLWSDKIVHDFSRHYWSVSDYSLGLDVASNIYTDGTEIKLYRFGGFNWNIEQ